MPDIKLPDGSIRSFEQPVTIAEVAASIGAGLARAALAGKVDGVVVGTVRGAAPLTNGITRIAVSVTVRHEVREAERLLHAA